MYKESIANRKSVYNNNNNNSSRLIEQSGAKEGLNVELDEQWWRTSAVETCGTLYKRGNSDLSCVYEFCRLN